MTLYGFDISNNNGPGLSIAEIQREGFAWCEMKVTEGDYFTDPEWSDYKAQADACGMPIIGYHYAVASSAPAAQATHFQAAGGGTRVMIDFEDRSGDIADYWNLVAAFNAIGITVAASYVPQWYWQRIGCPDLSQVPGLIASAYPKSSAGYASVLYQGDGGDSGEGWTPYGNGNPVMWQFTDCALVDGGSVDANAFRGSLDDLNALLGGDMALTSQQAQQLQEIWEQLRGPNGAGWPQLGTNAAGQNLTLVDGEAELITQSGALISMVNQLVTTVNQLATDVAELKGRQ